MSAFASTRPWPRRRRDQSELGIVLDLPWQTLRGDLKVPDCGAPQFRLLQGRPLCPGHTSGARRGRDLHLRPCPRLLRLLPCPCLYTVSADPGPSGGPVSTGLVLCARNAPTPPPPLSFIGPSTPPSCTADLPTAPRVSSWGAGGRHSVDVQTGIPAGYARPRGAANMGPERGTDSTQPTKHREASRSAVPRVARLVVTSLGLLADPPQPLSPRVTTRNPELSSVPRRALTTTTDRRPEIRVQHGDTYALIGKQSPVPPSQGSCRTA